MGSYSNGNCSNVFNVVGWVETDFSALQPALTPTLLILILQFVQLFTTFEGQFIFFLTAVIVQRPDKHPTTITGSFLCKRVVVVPSLLSRSVAAPATVVGGEFA